MWRRSSSSVGLLPDMARVEDGVHDAPSAREDPRESRSGAHDLGDKLKEARIGAQHREKLKRGRKLAQKLVEGCERKVWIARVSKRLEKGRRELGEVLACAGAFHRWIAPVMPSLDCGDGG